MAETVAFLKKNKSALTKKEDEEAGKREMVAQQTISRRADLRATNEKFHCTSVLSSHVYPQYYHRRGFSMKYSRERCKLRFLPLEM